MLYERTALSKKPEKLIRQELEELRENDTFTPDLVFKDPYFLNFLGLEDTYSEKSLEDAILSELEKFLLELGSGFTFVERQKRMIIDGEDHYLDLLFYHRKLKRLIAIELKLGKFKASYKGHHEQIELLQLNHSGIKVAEYLTELPEKALLKEKVHRALMQNKKRLENKG